MRLVLLTQKNYQFIFLETKVLIPHGKVPSEKDENCYFIYNKRNSISEYQLNLSRWRSGKKSFKRTIKYSL